MEGGSVVVAFSGTLDAFAFEDAARAAGVPGRLIPLPTGIAATCGLAWRLPPDAEVASLGALAALRREGVYRLVADRYARVDA